MENLLKIDEESNTSGKKIVIHCQNRIKNDTTNGWLNNLQQLSTLNQSKRNMSNRRILSGIFNKNKKVVVKMDRFRNEIINEWNTYQKLIENQIPNILPIYCFFSCLDDLSKYSGEKKVDSMCQKTGEPIYVIVMKYIDNPNLKMMDWMPNDLPIIKSVLQQVLCTLLDAYLKIGFTHGDLNLQNILLESIDKNNIQTYHFEGHIIKIPIIKYRIHLMDFEFSKFHQPIQNFYIDLKMFFSKINYNFTIQLLNTDIIFTYINNLLQSNKNPIHVIPLIQKINELQVIDSVFERPKQRTYQPFL